MSRLAAGDQIATVPCGHCGRPCRVVLNRRGGAYYTCGHPVAGGRSCGHFERWGTVASTALQRAHLSRGRAVLHVEDRRELAQILDPPAPDPTPTPDQAPTPAPEPEQTPDKHDDEDRNGLFG